MLSTPFARAELARLRAETIAMKSEVAALKHLAAQRRAETARLRFESNYAAWRLERAWSAYVRARKANFNPNQPRVPAGNPDGGQWTSGGGGIADGSSAGRNDARVISDATPDDLWKPGAQYAANVPRLPRGIPAIRRRFPEAEPGQHVRLLFAQERADAAIREAQQRNPTWKPRSLSQPQTIESAIRFEQEMYREARSEIQRLTAGSNSLAGRSPPPPQAGTGVPGTPPFRPPHWIDVYRQAHNMPDLFGRDTWPADKGTVAAAEIDGLAFFGVNSNAPGYTKADRVAAERMRDILILKYPDVMNEIVGRRPNNSLFHAEATLLLRAAREKGGLGGRHIEVHADRAMCWSCDKVLPKLGLELGNPTVTFVNRRTGSHRSMRDGYWVER